VIETAFPFPYLFFPGKGDTNVYPRMSDQDMEDVIEAVCDVAKVKRGKGRKAKGKRQKGERERGKGGREVQEF
jgi:hypothetical protein